MFRPFLGKAYRDWEQATDSKQHITHICSMTFTVEPSKERTRVSRWSQKVLIQTEVKEMEPEIGNSLEACADQRTKARRVHLMLTN